jgi:omega-6 fatty acid desaturase (delta-12 desaturase)
VRAAYRVGNDPRVLFSVVPLAYFVVFMRVRARWQENVAVCALWLGLWKLGLAWAHTIPMALAASLGFLMFHAQHTFEGCYRRRGRAWSAFDNGMLGSSLLVLPGGRVLGPAVRFFAHGVEYHHAHHLSPKIPGYRLAACHAEAGALFDACPRVTLRQALATASYNLYDEARGRFVDVRRLG